MRAVVYYDLEQVSPDCIRRAAAAVGNDAIHVRPTDAIWPESSAVESATIWPQRDYRFRELVMDQFDRLAEATGRILHHDVDLLEALRYEWVFATEDVFHRAWTVAELVRRHGPTRLHWVTSDPRYLAVIRAVCEAQKLRCSIDCSRLDRLKNMLGRPTELLRNRLWLLREKHRLRRYLSELTQRRNSREAPRRPVVFAEIYPNNTKLALQISEAMERSSGVGGVFVGGRKEVCDLVLAGGRPCFLMDEFRPARQTPMPLDQMRAQLSRGTADAFSRRIAGDSTGAGGPLGENVKPVTAHAARVGQNLLGVAADWSERICEMICRLQPQAIVSTTYAGIFGRVLALAGKAHGVPAAYVQHGILGEGRFLSHFPYNRLLLWGDNVVRAYQSQGVPLERMRVVGSPLYDESTNARDRKARGQKPEGGSSSSVLVLGSRPGGSVVNSTLFERILRATAAAVLSQPNRSLVVKLHPADHSGIAQRMFNGHDRVRVVETASVSNLLSDCDVAIVTSSTTGLEACALDKPLIEFDPTGTQAMIDYARYGAAICVGHESDLQPALDKVLSDERTRQELALGRRRLLDDVLNGGNCNATQAAATEILNMMNDVRTPAVVSS
jgi:hypothetical protein